MGATFGKPLGTLRPQPSGYTLKHAGEPQLPPRALPATSNWPPTDSLCGWHLLHARGTTAPPLLQMRPPASPRCALSWERAILC